MLTRLRAQLTLLFVLLVMLVYAADAGFSLWLFDHQLTDTIFNNLTRLCQDIEPNVSVAGNRPTLAQWGKAVERLHVSNSVQLYDRQGALLEEYGSRAPVKLTQGRLSDGGQFKGQTFYSHYIRIDDKGYLQIAISSDQHDMAIGAFLATKLVRIALITFAIGLCGWFYSGRAIQPVVRSLKTLRTFVDDAGHELNTPVTLIENSLETLEAHLNDHGLPVDILQIIQGASTRLKSLSSNLVLLAKMEYPELALRFTTVRPADLLNEVVGGLRDKASTSGIDIAIDPIPNVSISGDHDALIRMYSNLVENAIRYTSAGGRITVIGSKHENSFSLRVSDTGIGIPEDSLPFIFDRFYRVDKARSRAAGGAGLGLSIVKAIAEAHGGSIKVESQVGKGSSFVVNLPISV